MRIAQTFCACVLMVLAATAVAAAAQLQPGQPAPGEPVPEPSLQGPRGYEDTPQLQLAQAHRSGCRRGNIFERLKNRRSCRTSRRRNRRPESQHLGARNPASGERGVRRRVRTARARSGYRTICVRLCDGYYFPLSFAAPRKRFARDAEKCASQYPPGEAMLFYYPNRGDPKRAIAVSGERYAKQPYAFLYRSTFDAHCAKRLHHGLAVLGQHVIGKLQTSDKQSEAPDAKSKPARLIPIPIARADLSLDPETTANRRGSFSPRLAAQRLATASASMRTVGDPDYTNQGSTGPPATVPGYEPPELQDFRVPLQATMLPLTQ